MFKKPLWQTVDPNQTAPIEAVCCGSVLFVSIFNLSVMLGNYLQKTTSADDIFRCIFSWRLKGKNSMTFQDIYSLACTVESSKWP